MYAFCVAIYIIYFVVQDLKDRKDDDISQRQFKEEKDDNDQRQLSKERLSSSEGNNLSHKSFV